MRENERVEIRAMSLLVFGVNLWNSSFKRHFVDMHNAATQVCYINELIRDQIIK